MRSLDEWQKEVLEFASADQYQVTGGVKQYLNWLITVLEKNSTQWSVPKKAQILLKIMQALGFNNPMEAIRATQLANTQFRRGMELPKEADSPEQKPQ